MSRTTWRPIVGISAIASLVVVIAALAQQPAQQPATQPSSAPPDNGAASTTNSEANSAANPNTATPAAVVQAEVIRAEPPVIVGRVEAHDNTVLGIVVPAEATPAAGDSFEVFLTTPAGRRSRVGRGKLSFAKNGVVLGRLDEATGELALGQEVRIQSVSPAVETAKHAGTFVGDDAQFPFALQVETRAGLTTVRGLGRIPYSAADPRPILAEFVGISAADAPQSLRGVLTLQADGKRLLEKQRSPWVGLYDPARDDWQLMLSPKHTVGTSRSGAPAKSAVTSAQAGAAADGAPQPNVPLTVGDLASPVGPVTNVPNPSPLVTQWNQVTTALADLGRRTPAAAKKGSSKGSSADSLAFLERITYAAASGDEDWLDFDYELLPPITYGDFARVEHQALSVVEQQERLNGRQLNPQARLDAIRRETNTRLVAVLADRRAQLNRLLEQEMRDRYGARPVPPSNATPTGSTRVAPPTSTATPAPPKPTGTTPAVATNGPTTSGGATPVTPVPPPLPPTPPSPPTMTFDEAVAFLNALGMSHDRISTVLVPAPDAARAWQVAEIRRIPGGRIEIVNYGNAPDGPNVAQGGTTTTTGGASQNTPPNTPPNNPPNSTGGTATTGGANSGATSGGGSGAGTPSGNGGAPQTPNATSLVNNDGASRVPGSPPNMPPPTVTTSPPPPRPADMRDVHAATTGLAPYTMNIDNPGANAATVPAARPTGTRPQNTYDPNVTVLVDGDSGQAPTPALTQAQINAARAALNRNMVAGGVQTLAKGPDAANHVAPSAGATVSTAAPATGHTPPANAPVKPVEDFQAQPPGGVCHDYVLDRLGLPNNTGRPYRGPTDVDQGLDALGYTPAAHTGPTDRLPPGTVIQWGDDHVGIVGPDGRIYHFTQAASGRNRPAAVNVSDTIDDVTRTSHTLTNAGTGQTYERRPYENQPIRIRVPQQTSGSLPVPDWIQRGLTTNVTGRRDGSGLHPVQPPTRTPSPADVTSVPATPPSVTPPTVTTSPPPPRPADMRDVHAATTGLAPYTMNIDNPGANAATVPAARPTGTRPQNTYDPNVTVLVDGDSGQAPTPALTQAQINAARAALNRNMVAGGVQTLAKGPKGTDADQHHDAPGKKPDEKKPHLAAGTWKLIEKDWTAEMTITVNGKSIHLVGTAQTSLGTHSSTGDGTVTGPDNGPYTFNVTTNGYASTGTIAVSADGSTMTATGSGTTTIWKRVK